MEPAAMSPGARWRWDEEVAASGRPLHLPKVLAANRGLRSERYRISRASWRWRTVAWLRRLVRQPAEGTVVEPGQLAHRGDRTPMRRRA
jgi:hypothetical protein